MSKHLKNLPKPTEFMLEGVIQSMASSLLQSFTVDAVHVEIHADRPACGRHAADFVIAEIQKTLTAKPIAAVIFATGASQYEFLETIIGRTDVAWDRVRAFHLDEYLGISDRHPASFRRYLHDRLFDHISFESVRLLEGDAVDPQAEAARYDALLRAQPIDVACIGIGENGHLAFNDPPADFETDAWVHIVELDEACRRQQVGEGHFPDMAAVPAQALSLSIPAIMAAQVISCVAPDARKATAVANALQGPITPNCPASVLRRHGGTRLYLDPGSAALLENRGSDVG